MPLPRSKLSAVANAPFLGLIQAELPSSELRGVDISGRISLSTSQQRDLKNERLV